MLLTLFGAQAATLPATVPSVSGFVTKTGTNSVSLSLSDFSSTPAVGSTLIVIAGTADNNGSYDAGTDTTTFSSTMSTPSGWASGWTSGYGDNQHYTNVFTHTVASGETTYTFTATTADALNPVSLVAYWSPSPVSVDIKSAIITQTSNSVNSALSVTTTSASTILQACMGTTIGSTNSAVSLNAADGPVSSTSSTNTNAAGLRQYVSAGWFNQAGAGTTSARTAVASSTPAVFFNNTSVTLALTVYAAPTAGSGTTTGSGSVAASGRLIAQSTPTGAGAVTGSVATQTITSAPSGAGLISATGSIVFTGTSTPSATGTATDSGTLLRATSSTNATATADGASAQGNPAAAAGASTAVSGYVLLATATTSGDGLVTTSSRQTSTATSTGQGTSAAATSVSATSATAGVGVVSAGVTQKTNAVGVGTATSSAVIIAKSSPVGVGASAANPTTAATSSFLGAGVATASVVVGAAGSALGAGTGTGVFGTGLSASVTDNAGVSDSASVGSSLSVSVTDNAGVFESRTNLAPNPSGEVNTSGWNWQSQSSGDTATVSQNATSPLYGSFVIRALITAPQTATSNHGMQIGSSGTVSSGDTITASVWIRPSRTNVFKFGLDFTGGGNSAAATAVSCPAGVWTQISATGVAAAGTTGVFGNLWTDSTAGSVFWQTDDIIDFDGLLIEKAATVGEFVATTAPSVTYSFVKSSALTDVAGISDAASTLLINGAPATDNAGVSDLATSSIARGGVVTDDGGTTDQATPDLLRGIKLTDRTTMYDKVTTLISHTKSVTVTDQSGVHDSVYAYLVNRPHGSWGAQINRSHG